MTTDEQSLVWFRQYLRCRQLAPWIAMEAAVEQKARAVLDGLGGLQRSWKCKLNHWEIKEHKYYD